MRTDELLQQIKALKGLVQSLKAKHGDNVQLTKPMIDGERIGSLSDVLSLSVDNEATCMINPSARVVDYEHKWTAQMRDLSVPHLLFVSNGDGSFYELGRPSVVITIPESRMIDCAPSVPVGCKIIAVEDDDGNYWGTHPYVGL